MPLAKFSWICAALFLLATLPASAGTWTALANTAPGAVGHMLLLSDGTVMAENDDDSGTFGPAWYRLTPDASGSYVNGTWSTLAPMFNTRLFFASQVLLDGRVFVAGGEYGTGGAAAEVYDPVANTWTQAPSPGHTFSDADSEILPNGNVIVALVEGSLKGTIIYNTSSNTWTTGPTCNGIHNESAWVKLPDNSILFVDRGATTTDRYIPASNTWITDAIVPVSLYDPYGLESGPGMLLPNGKVIFFGSTGHNAIYTPSGSTANGTWVAAPNFPNGQGQPDAPCAMMPNGNILLATAPVPVSGNVFQSPTSFYEYNYLTNSFTQVNAPAGGTTEGGSSYQRDMLLLPDGTVLSSRFDSQLYVYSGGGPPLAAGQPTITSISQNADGSFHLVGTLLNGISQGACYGDDNQDSTNRPIVRFTSGSNVYYARTYNWSSDGVATGSTSTTTEFAVPGNVPSGTYSLVAVANGIASSSYSFSYTAPPSTVSPAAGFSASGVPGGPFIPTSIVYTLTNNSATSLNWSAARSQGWVNVSPTSGSLASGASVPITVSVGSSANGFATGSYSATITLKDNTNSLSNTRNISLVVHNDYFTELFASGSNSNDTSNQSWLFTPNNSAGFYGVQHTHVSSFPTDPTGGTTLTEGDDSFVQVSPTGSASVLLYGTSYSTFYVGSNGYITFTSGDTDPIESLSAHFSLPRIAPLFRDLDPTSQGTISWKQLSDRVAVTWQNVPEIGTTNSNNFQVEMFFNGQVRITCLGIASTGGLIGLSRGQGVPSDYGPSDFDLYSYNNPTLANLVLSAGTLTPSFVSSTIAYTASVPYTTSSLTVTPTAADSLASIKVSGTAVSTGTASSPISLAVGSNSIPTVVTAPNGTTIQTYTITVTRLTNLQSWRQTYFGITSNSGSAANTAIPANDGLTNLMKFATNLNPTVASMAPGTLVLNGGNLVFTYPRSDAAVADGLTFTVEWSDTLATGSWSNTGITESILTDNGTVQQVQDTIPLGADGQRYVHLKVSTTSNQ